MPKPRKKETKSKFMSRCISDVIKEGKKRDQAIAQCINVWGDSHKATVEINAVHGLTMLYDPEHEVIVDFLFDEQMYTKEEAEKWIEDNVELCDSIVSLVNETRKELI
jgi:hypothetical protein